MDKTYEMNLVNYGEDSAAKRSEAASKVTRTYNAEKTAFTSGWGTHV